MCAYFLDNSSGFASHAPSVAPLEALSNKWRSAKAQGVSPSRISFGEFSDGIKRLGRKLPREIKLEIVCRILGHSIKDGFSFAKIFGLSKSQLRTCLLRPEVLAKHKALSHELLRELKNLIGGPEDSEEALEFVDSLDAALKKTPISGAEVEAIAGKLSLRQSAIFRRLISEVDAFYADFLRERKLVSGVKQYALLSLGEDLALRFIEEQRRSLVGCYYSRDFRRFLWHQLRQLDSEGLRLAARRVFKDRSCFAEKTKDFLDYLKILENTKVSRKQINLVESERDKVVCDYLENSSTIGKVLRLSLVYDPLLTKEQVLKCCSNLSIDPATAERALRAARVENFSFRKNMRGILARQRLEEELVNSVASENDVPASCLCVEVDSESGELKVVWKNDLKAAAPTDLGVRMVDLLGSMPGFKPLGQGYYSEVADDMLYVSEQYWDHLGCTKGKFVMSLCGTPLIHGKDSKGELFLSVVDGNIVRFRIPPGLDYKMGERCEGEHFAAVLYKGLVPHSIVQFDGEKFRHDEVKTSRVQMRHVGGELYYAGPGKIKPNRSLLFRSTKRGFSQVAEFDGESEHLGASNGRIYLVLREKEGRDNFRIALQNGNEFFISELLHDLNLFHIRPFSGGVVLRWDEKFWEFDRKLVPQRSCYSMRIKEEFLNGYLIKPTLSSLTTMFYCESGKEVAICEVRDREVEVKTEKMLLIVLKPDPQGEKQLLLFDGKRLGPIARGHDICRVRVLDDIVYFTLVTKDALGSAELAQPAVYVGNTLKLGESGEYKYSAGQVWHRKYESGEEGFVFFDGVGFSQSAKFKSISGPVRYGNRDYVAVEVPGGVFKLVSPQSESVQELQGRGELVLRGELMEWVRTDTPSEGPKITTFFLNETPQKELVLSRMDRRKLELLEAIREPSEVRFKAFKRRHPELYGAASRKVALTKHVIQSRALAEVLIQAIRNIPREALGVLSAVSGPSSNQEKINLVAELFDSSDDSSHKLSELALRLKEEVLSWGSLLLERMRASLSNMKLSRRPKTSKSVGTIVPNLESLDTGGGDPRQGEGPDLFKVDTPTYGFLYTGRFGNWNSKKKHWEPLPYSPACPSSELRPVSFRIPNLANFEKAPDGTLVLPFFLGGGIDPKTICGFTKKDSSPRSLEAKELEDGRLAVRVSRSLKSLELTLSKPEQLPGLSKISLEQYEGFKAKHVVDHGEDLTREIAPLDLEDKVFIDSLEKLSPRDKVIEIERYLRTGGYYDFDNAEVSGGKVGCSMKRRFKLMRKRQAELSKTAKGKERDLILRRREAGVCVNFAERGVHLLRAAGFLAGLGTGFPFAYSKSVSAKDAHALAVVFWPNSEDGYYEVPVDMTPYGVNQAQERYLKTFRLSGIEERDRWKAQEEYQNWRDAAKHKQSEGKGRRIAKSNVSVGDLVLSIEEGGSTNIADVKPERPQPRPATYYDLDKLRFCLDILSYAAPSMRGREGLRILTEDFRSERSTVQQKLPLPERELHVLLAEMIVRSTHSRTRGSFKEALVKMNSALASLDEVLNPDLLDLARDSLEKMRVS